MASTDGAANQKNDKPKMSERVEATLVGFYIIFSVLNVYVLVSIWPQTGTSNSTAAPIHLLLWSFYLPDEIRLLLLVIMSASLGGFVMGGWNLSDYAGGNLDRSGVLWYIFQPFLGPALALIFYFVVRGGFLTGTISLSNINAYGVSGLSGLVGMFSFDAIEKLHEVFQEMFKHA